MSLKPGSSECVVYGTLGFVLRVSQFYGVASLKFESEPNGWRIRVSRAANIYSKILILLLSILSVTSIVWDFRQGQKYSFLSGRHADSVMNVLSVTVTLTVLFAEAYSGMKRMQHVVDCLCRVQKINLELAHCGKYKSFEKLAMVIATWSLLGGHIINFTDYFIFAYEVIYRKGNYVMEALFVAYCAENIMMKILILQLFMILLTVLCSFIHLNDCLNNLLIQIRKESQTKELLSTSSTTLHRLGALYCSLRDVVHELNDSQGLLMVPLAASFLVHHVITPYFCFSRIFGTKAEFYKAVSQSWWLVYYIIDMVSIVEPCHRTFYQVDRTKHLISQLMRVTPLTDHAFNSELGLFYKHLVVKEVSYTPMRMFTINRSLIATIIGSTITYLVVLIEL